MKKVILLCTTYLLISTLLFGQNFDIHVPKEIKQAYNNGTRDISGKPGEKYWHNTADYTLKVTVNPETRGISGSGSIVYYNNSPNTLNRIVIRLYYDVFKKGNERGMEVNTEDIHDGVNISNFKIDGQDYPMDNPRAVNRNGTNMVINLMKPIPTGGKVMVSMDWEQKVPLTVRRTGAKDPTSFFIAYWYPQVSVYDDIFGWDYINYTFDTEFYNNLGNYDVTINAPDNFLVWSTGELQNAEDIFPKDILERYNQAKTSVKTIHVVDSTDLESLKLKSGSWHYKASEVSDFAFAMSDHYAWDAASQKVEGKPVFIGTAFPANEAARYEDVTAIQQKTMMHFSQDIPGVPYPYPVFTTFIGLNGGGMEFPMMANNGGPGRGVTIHEMFHTYFPMYVRINERRWAWMDEGWADFATSIVSHKFFEEPNPNSSFISDMKPSLNSMSGTIGDLPTVTSSQYMGNNYGYHSYGLPSFTYAMLYYHLGEELFLKCYREYINRWAKKSPTPYDFFFTFEDVSGQDLNWLWEPWYFGFGYSDVAIKSFDKGVLTIENKGTRPVPITVSIEYEDGKSDYQIYSAKKLAQSKEFQVEIDKPKKVKSIKVNKDIVDTEFMDNFHPSLDEIYEEFNIDENIIGSYRANEYPVSIVLEKKGKILAISIPEAGIEGFLTPDKENFVSIDDGLYLEFTKTDGKITGCKLTLKMFGGVVLTGNKQ